MRFCLLLFLALPGWAAAQAAFTMEAVADAYLKSSSYCDSGKRGQRYMPMQERFREESFKRCAERGGRFKRFETLGAGSEIRWSDGKSFFRYLPYNRRYQEVSLDDPVTYDLYRNRAEIYAVFIFEIFSSEAYRFRDPAGRAEYLKSFVPAPPLANAQYRVFERFPAGTKYGERVWVANADRSIARWEYVQDGVVTRYVAVTSHQFDRPLGEADLSYPVPFFARYSLMNNAPVFIAALFAAAGVLGVLVWGAAFVQASDREALRANRRFLWKLHFWVYGTMALLLALLAALTWGGGGHPPAIIFVAAIAAWTAIVLAMTALFTAASYPAEWFAPKR